MKPAGGGCSVSLALLLAAAAVGAPARIAGAPALPVLQVPLSTLLVQQTKFVVMGGCSANMSSARAVAQLQAAHFNCVDSQGDATGVALAEASGLQLLVPPTSKHTSSPAVVAINLGDEPRCPDFLELAGRYRQAEVSYPDKLIFVNLRPIPSDGNGTKNCAPPPSLPPRKHGCVYTCGRRGCGMFDLRKVCRQFHQDCQAEHVRFDTSRR